MGASNALEALVGSMTLAELADRSGRSVESIVQWAMANGAAPRRTGRATNGTPTAPSARTSAKAVNTRTKEGRVAYDKAVLDTVKGSESPIGATAIRKEVGGTPLQVRAALDRLIESGAVTYQGRARATRYSAS
jgi:hypothetical protein